jgi:hypothetical protein
MSPKFRNLLAGIILLINFAFAEQVRSEEITFRPFDNSRVQRRESHNKQTIIGPKQRLIIYIQPALRKHIESFVKMLSDLTGQKPVLSFWKPGAKDKGYRIIIGHPDWMDAKSFPQKDNIENEHGFFIRTLEDAEYPTLWIAGNSQAATIYAVEYFLNNYCGVRRVMGGKLGMIAARQDAIDIPAFINIIHPGPDFILRDWSGFDRDRGGLDKKYWLLSIDGMFQYHHNLFNIFAPEKYATKYPGIYPFYDGKRHVPRKGVKGGWQICFTHPKAVDITMDYAREFFTRNPHAKSFSVSVNDAAGYCYCDKCRILNESGRKKGDKFSASGSYYAYVNAVAHRLAKEQPGKYVAFLAYQYVREPPSSSLEKNVMVFITKEPLPFMEKWRGKVSNYGLYQFIYGNSWVIANHWPHAMQEYLQKLHKKGLCAFKAESYCGWGFNGPKLWVLANLLWDVDLDVDAALEDYYLHTYGRETMPDMKLFYEKWEDIYSRRRSKNEYFFSTWRPGLKQFEHVTSQDYQIMGKLLNSAINKVQGEDNRQRLEFTLRAFEQGRFLFQKYDIIREIKTAKLSSIKQAETFITLAAQYHSIEPKREKHFKSYIQGTGFNIFYTDQFVMFSRDFNFSVSYNQAVGKLFQQISALLQKSGASEERIIKYWSNLAKQHSSLRSYIDYQLIQARNKGKALPNIISDNPSFEKPLGRNATHNWIPYSIRNFNAVIERDNKTSSEGKWSGTIRGAVDYLGGFRRILWLHIGGRYRLSFKYKTKQVPSTAHYELMVAWNSTWRHKEALAPAETWTEHECVFTLPESSLFTAGDVSNWQALIIKIKKQAKSATPSPGKIIWELMSDEGKRICKQVIEGTLPAKNARAPITAELKRILSLPIYNEMAWRGIKLDPQTKALLAKNLKAGDKELLRLNRHLFEASYPKEAVQKLSESFRINLTLFAAQQSETGQVWFDDVKLEALDYVQQATGK